MHACRSHTGTLHRPAAPGTCTGVMYGKPSSRSAPSTRGCSRSGSDSHEPSVTCSIALPAAAAAATRMLPGRRRRALPLPAARGLPGTELQQQSSGGRGKRRTTGCCEVTAGRGSGRRGRGPERCCPSCAATWLGRRPTVPTAASPARSPSAPVRGRWQHNTASGPKDNWAWRDWTEVHPSPGAGLMMGPRSLPGTINVAHFRERETPKGEPSPHPGLSTGGGHSIVHAHSFGSFYPSPATGRAPQHSAFPAPCTAGSLTPSRSLQRNVPSPMPFLPNHYSSPCFGFFLHGTCHLCAN